MIERWDPLFALTRITGVSNLEEWSMIWIMFILFPQTSNLRIKKLCSMCLKTTNQDDVKGKKPDNETSFQNPQSCSWLVVRSNQYGPQIHIKYTDTKNQLADMLTKGNFTRDTWNHLLCLFNISHFSSAECSEVMSKRTQKESGEERVTAKSRTMMNLIARSSERAPAALSSTASESPVKTRQESQNPLSPQAEKHYRTVRPVVYAYSSSYSDWNVDKTWSSQEWKSDELMDDRTGQPVVTAQHTDRFIIENDKMNSYTEAESELSLGSRSFLHRKNDQVRKRQKQSSTYALKDSDNHSVIWWMFMSSTLQASVLMEKNYSDNWHSIKNTEDLTMKQMFDISEKLVSEQSDEIYGKTLHGSICLWLVMNMSSVSSAQKVYVFSDSV